MIVPLALFCFLLKQIPHISAGGTYLETFQWIPSLGIQLAMYVDGLSLTLSLLITGIGSLVVLYSIYYLSMEREALHRFYIYLLIFMGSMLGVVFSDHLLVLYVFWELTSISSFLLIAFWYHRRQSRYGAQKSLLITVAGGLSMLVGFLMMGGMADTFSIRELLGEMAKYTNHEWFTPAMILVLLGAFTKSAQFPFHIWLPDAMEAPTPVSAYLHSATMVKAGIYLVARFTPLFGGGPVWFWVVTSVGLVTLLWGSFSAIRQTDLKAMLAYSTISQLGLMMSLLGFGSAALHFDQIDDLTVAYSLGIFAAIFHLVNHALFKAALFMVVGIVDHETGTRDIRKLSGLMAVMPITFTLAVAGSFSMAGLPPFNGFLSKEMFFTSVLNASELTVFSMESWGAILLVVAWVASIFTFVYCCVFVFRTFFGKHEPEKLDKKAHEPPVGMLIAPVILISLVVVTFFFPNVIGRHLLKPAYDAILPLYASTGTTAFQIDAWHGKITTELWMTAGVIVVGVLLYRILPYWMWVYALFPRKWSFDSLYHGSLLRMEQSAQMMTRRYMTGNMHHYLVYIFVIVLTMIASTLFISGAFQIDTSQDAPIRVYEMILSVVMMVAAISILFAKSRLTAIILNGVLGYMLALFFVFFRAPDLALTQLVVETVSAALFLLCFYFLPKWEKEKSSARTKVMNMVIALSAGTIVTLVALSVHSQRLFESISTFYEDAYELTGAKNIVNAILGDFRAFDTMMEVVVLMTAGLGVYILIKLTHKKGGQDVENQ